MRSAGESTMSLGWRAGALLLTIALLASRCGGHGAENFTGTPNPSGSPGGPTGAADFEASIGPVGSSNPQASLVTFRVLNADGRPAKNGIRVIFSLEGSTDAKLGQTKDKTSDGFVSTVVQAGSVSGIVVVVARVDGTNLIARSAVITIGHAQGQAVAIEFFGLRVPGLLGTGTDNAGTPTTRTQLGVRGSGFAQSVDVVFVVFDQFGGAAANGTIIDFNLFGPNGGEGIAPTSAQTNQGFVSATITTGSRPGPVEVTAKVRGTGIVARAIPITSAVSFFTSGGGIIAQGLTGDHLSASADLVTQLPIPDNRRVVVMAVT